MKKIFKGLILFVIIGSFQFVSAQSSILLDIDISSASATATTNSGAVDAHSKYNQTGNRKGTAEARGDWNGDITFIMYADTVGLTAGSDTDSLTIFLQFYTAGRWVNAFAVAWDLLPATNIGGALADSNFTTVDVGLYSTRYFIYKYATSDTTHPRPDRFRLTYSATAVSYFTFDIRYFLGE